MASRSKRAAQGDRQRDEKAPAASDQNDEGDDELDSAEPAAEELAAFAATPEALAALTPENDASEPVEPRSMVIDFDADAIEATESLAGAARAPLMSPSALVSYLQELRVHPLLDREEEHTLAVKYAKTHDDAAARRLITANLRLVVKISQEYRRAHKNLLDLIQEGNIGLIQAVQKYDPYRGVKLSSYAAWWIRAYILKFILANWRIVKIGTTQAQRKLFFNLRKEREKLEKAGLEVEARHLAAALDVTEQDVIDMERRLGSSEMSLDSPVRGDEGAERSQGDFVPAAPTVRPDVQAEVGEFQELLRQKLSLFSERLRDRELDIFRARLLSDAPATLQEIGERYGVSRERARQIEERLKKKLRDFLQAELGDAVEITGLG